MSPTPKMESGAFSAPDDVGVDDDGLDEASDDQWAQLDYYSHVMDPSADDRLYDEAVGPPEYDDSDDDDAHWIH